MSNSSLASAFIPSPHHQARPSSKIDKIPIHVTASTGTAKSTANYFALPATGASSHYIIGGDGDIVRTVDESRMAYTTGGGTKVHGGLRGYQVDERGITIEVCNSIAAHPWPVSDKAYTTLLNLVEDIARRNGMKEVTYNADGSGTLQAHRWFSAKACPGDYLMERFPEIARIVTERLNGNPSSAPVTTATQATTESTSTNYTVKKTCSDGLNIRSGAGVSYDVVGVIEDSLSYTIVEEKDGWGKLKSGVGWISLNYTARQ